MSESWNKKWRKEYDEIPVPPEAKERLLAGIAQGRGAKQPERVIWRRAGRRFAAAAAVAVIAVTVLANASPTMAEAMGQIPVIGALAKVVTFRTYENRTNDFEAEIAVPKVEGSGADVPANKTIEEYANELIAMYEKDLRAANGEGNYSLSSSYQVVTDTPRYLSIRINTTLVMASGSEFVKVFTIDRTTGEVVTLSQLTAGEPGLLEKISDNIKEQMKSQMAADPNVIYFLDSDTPEWDFKGLKGDESFYFNEKGELVIDFDEYEVAPGYMGAVEFTIPETVTGALGS